MKRVIFAALAVVAMASCTKQDSFEGNTPTTEEQPVKITSGIATRVIDTSWEKGDKIGIIVNCLYYNGPSYDSPRYETRSDSNSTEDEFKNYYPYTQYTADQSGAVSSFTVEEGKQPLYALNIDLENAGAGLEAYYPASIYNEEKGAAELDISDQTDLKKLDVLYSRGDFGNSEYSENVRLNFYRQMSKVIFRIKSVDSSISLADADIKFEIEDIKVKGDPTMLFYKESPIPDEYGTLEGVVESGKDGEKLVTCMLFPSSNVAHDSPKAPDGPTPTDTPDAIIKVTIDGKPYYTRFDLGLMCGYQLRVTLTVGYEDITISGATIEDWVDDDTVTDLPPSYEYDGAMTIDDFIAIANGSKAMPRSDIWTISGNSAAFDGSFSEKINDMLSWENRTVSLIFSDITSIVDGAFCGFSNLREFSAPKATSLGTMAFYDCSSLQNVSLPELQTITGDNAFGECANLQKVAFEKLTGDIPASTFISCTKLSSADLPLIDGIIGANVFLNCSALSKINAPQVTELGSSAFRMCDRLEEVSLPLVKSVGPLAFATCENLKSISLPAVTSLSENVFRDCEELREIEAATVEGAVLEAVGYIFDEPYNMNVTLTVGAANSSMVTHGVSLYDFDNCDALTITFGGFTRAQAFKKIIVLGE